MMLRYVRATLGDKFAWGQSILLIALATLIVGVSIAFGIRQFHQNAEPAAEDAMLKDAVDSALKAQTWYYRPGTFGGGNRSFEKFTLATIGKSSTDSSRANHPRYVYSIDNQTPAELTLRVQTAVPDAGRPVASFRARITADTIAVKRVSPGDTQLSASQRERPSAITRLTVTRQPAKQQLVGAVTDSAHTEAWEN